MAQTLHLESIYGFYHGQDPRTFSPDAECCTPQEIANHKKACEQAEKGEWSNDGSSCCWVTSEAIVCSTKMGIGVYQVVMDEEGDYVRDATYEDICRGRIPAAGRTVRSETKV